MKAARDQEVVGGIWLLRQQAKRLRVPASWFAWFYCAVGGGGQKNQKSILNLALCFPILLVPLIPKIKDFDKGKIRLAGIAS